MPGNNNKPPRERDALLPRGVGMYPCTGNCPNACPRRPLARVHCSISIPPALERPHAHTPTPSVHHRTAYYVRHKSDCFLDDCGAWKAENPTRNLVEKLLNMGDPKSGLLLCATYLLMQLQWIPWALTPARVPPRGSTSTEDTAYDGCLSVLGTTTEPTSTGCDPAPHTRTYTRIVCW